MRRSPLLAAVGCVIVALSGCGTQVAGRLTGTASADPHQRAVADAGGIIASFPVPPGAERSARAPSSLLNAPAEGPPATPDVATDTGWWTAPGQPQAVLAWVAAHVPAGFSVEGKGTQGYGSPYEWFEVFALAPVPNVLTQRWLLVDAVQGVNARTAIRVDSQVIWLPAKPPGGRIPSDAKVVTVTVRPDVGPVAARQRRADLPVTITDPTMVTKIATLIDGLPVFPPGTFSCPADFGGGIRLEFRATPTGPMLAQVTIDPAGCQQVSVMVNGQPQLTLKGNESLQSDILALANANWPVPPGSP